MLLEHDRTSPTRNGPRPSEDFRILLDTMLTGELFEDVVGKNELVLSRLVGIPTARVASALVAGEERGVFTHRARTLNSRTGQSEIVWQLSPLFTDLNRKFADFAEASSRLCKEVAAAASIRPPMDSRRNVDFNLRIAKTIFGKWSVDILALIYSRGALGFQEIHRALGQISDRVLSLRLGQMEQLGLVRRDVLGTKPPRTQYSLTGKGLRTAKLGEPVFLYLRIAEGLLGTEEAESPGRLSFR